MFRLSQASSEHRKQRLHLRDLSGPSLLSLAKQQVFISKQWPVVSSPSPSWPSLSSPCAGVQRPSCQLESRCCVEVGTVRYPPNQKKLLKPETLRLINLAHTLRSLVWSLHRLEHAELVVGSKAPGTLFHKRSMTRPEHVKILAARLNVQHPPSPRGLHLMVKSLRDAPLLSRLQ